MEEFINLKQGHMTVRECSLKFTKLSKYAPFMVAYPRAKMRKFIFRVLDLVSKEYKIALLVKEMDIFHLISYAKQIEEEKLREPSRESKRAQVDGGGYSH